MAAEIGVDRLCWELTDHPEDMFSRRFVPGSADYARIRHEIWDDNNLGNAIPGRDAARARSTSRHAALPGLPLDRAAAAAPCRARTRVTQPLDARRSRRRRATAAAWCASARSLRRRTAR